MNATNPLLAKIDTVFEAIPFDKVKVEHFLPALEVALQQAQQEIEVIANAQDEPTFENTVLALETSDESLSIVSSTYYHLFAAHASEELQSLATEISPKLASFSNDVYLNPKLFSRIKSVYENSDGLDQSAKRLTRHYFIQFKRNGALLDEEEKKQLRQIDNDLSGLRPKYSENVLKATNAFELLLTSESELEGLPDSVLEQAKEAAENKNKKGYLFTLQGPSFLPFMSYAKRRDLRKKVMLAFSSRAFSDGFSNEENVRAIANLRYQRATLLGYRSHADYVLEERMAQNSARVQTFLEDLLRVSKPAVAPELKELTELLHQDDPNAELMPWDVRYYSEKLKMQKYSFDQEQIRVFFSLEKVLEGIFAVAKKLYNISFKLVEVPTYHADVKVYEVLNSDGSHLGLFYTDLFPRETKKPGAWMNDIRSQGIFAGKLRRPHVSIVCNFTKPTKDKPALLTFEEVNTLFHEFGHALHSLLSQVKYSSLSGTHVHWDFVELPSQIMENWLLEKDTLDLFAEHYETKEKISQDLIDKLKAARQFMAGYYTIRQLSFAFLDMAWHSGDPGAIGDLDTFEKEAMQQSEVLPRPEGSNVSCAFSHIFSGGYSAGYYSYKWAEVLDADAFELFKEEGIFNQKVATSFRQNILEKGNLEDPMVLYLRFRGREPDVKALLRRDGLVA